MAILPFGKYNLLIRLAPQDAYFLGHREKSPNKESPNEKIPKSPKLKNMPKSGPDSPPQALGHREHSSGQRG